ncbi:uncharacterized protein LOC143427073 [Xylocopa sonorina]|uniref:uncharacterized protein LOC143427073 n=1 Tax=Xylocopa sonorina TaxID=1818115 RepID=UPI00403AA9B5
MEYTLEDAYETLQAVLKDREEEMENLTISIANNGPVAFNKSCDSQQFRKKRQKFCDNLTDRIRLDELKDYPVPGTSDLHVQVLTELEEEVENVQQLFDKLNAVLLDVKNNISYLRNKQKGLEKMKEAYLNTAEMVANTTYEKELVVTKRIFRGIKTDLHMVVDKLFPDNQNFKTFLGELTLAYTKGGDDTYVDVSPQDLLFVNFLVEAGIVAYHRNDKTKVRLMDML